MEDNNTDMDGVACFHALQCVNKVVKIMMASDYNENDETTKLYDKGLAGFIQKPYKLNTLKETLRQSIKPN